MNLLKMAISQHHIVIFVCTILELILLTESYQCYSCTYARSSDPRIGYDCVDNPTANTVARISCAADYYCKAVVEMDRDMTIIKSVVRNCLPIGQSCSGTTCCNRAGDQPSLWCEQKCADSLCNDINLENWLGTEDESSEEKEKYPIYLPENLFDVQKNQAETATYYFEWALLCFIVFAIFMLAERST